jgi:hypothetical protein
MSDPWELMQEAEHLRQLWPAAESEYEKAVADGKSAADLQVLSERTTQFKNAYFAKARRAIEATGSNE